MLVRDLTALNPLDVIRLRYFAKRLMEVRVERWSSEERIVGAAEALIRTAEGILPVIVMHGVQILLIVK